MRTLNDIPESWQESRSESWSVRKGMLRGIASTAIAAAILAGVLCLVTRVAPASTTVPWFESIIYSLVMATWNAIVGFGVCAILYAVMHRKSGLVGPTCDSVVILLTIGAIASKHIVLASIGMDWAIVDINGAAWLNPMNIFFTNIGAWIGTAIAVCMFRGGDSVRDYLGF